MKSKAIKILHQYRGLSIPYQAFLWVVVLPTLLTAIYFGIFASDIYVSESHFAVRNHGNAQAAGLLGGLLGAVGGSNSPQDTAVVIDYVQSHDILQSLEQTLKLREKFASHDVDIIARLAGDATEEDFLDYYRDKIEVLLDTTTGIVTLKTKAFDAQTAKAMGEKILAMSDTLINSLSDQMTDDGLKLSREEVTAAVGKLQQTNDALTNFQDSNNILDPAQKTGSVLGIVTGLENQLATARAELGELRGYLREDSSQIIAARNHIRALTQQIAEENNRLTGSEKSQLGTQVKEYERLMLERTLAGQFYSSALTSLEAARVDTMRKQLYLVTFVQPQLAQEALEPKRVWKTLTVFIISILVFVIGGLFWSTVKDHMGMG